jgi:diphosphomevalonate decarboxylase
LKARKWARVRDARKRIRESSESPHQQPANPDHCLRIESKNNFPTAAGLASSASGFACLAYGLAMLFQLDLAWTMEELSVLARIGSGSACRSFFPGFVEWRDDRRVESVESVDDEEYFALDCCARQLNYSFESMQILILVLESKVK